MAPLMYLSSRKVLILYLLSFLFTSLLFFASSETNHDPKNMQFLGRRRMLEKQEDQLHLPKKKTTNFSTKNETKLIKPNLSSKNQTKLIKTNSSTKNQTKLGSLSKLNSTKPISVSTKKLPDLIKLNSPKNKTAKPLSTKQKTETENKKSKDLLVESSKPIKKNQNFEEKTLESIKKKEVQEIKPIWSDVDLDGDNDFVSEIRDLPIKFQQNLIPDLEKISKNSKLYISNAKKQITKGFKPYVGNQYAPAIGSIVSCFFILVPLFLVSLIINRFKSYFSLQKVLIFVQIYLGIYFSILCLSSLVTGLEPLRFFYAASQTTYIWLQVLQTLGYVLYLLLLLMYLVLVFSTDCGLGLKFLALAQTFVGLAVGLHYYVAVFHRVVLRQPPKTNWKIHAVYATCFILICLLSGVERRKKTYLEECGEEGKKS